MVIVVGYFILYCTQWLQKYQRKMAYRRLVSGAAQQASILVRTVVEPVTKYLSEQPALSLVQASPACATKMLSEEGDKQIYTIAPRVSLDLRDWMSYLDSNRDKESSGDAQKHYILLETYPPSSEEEFLSQSQILLSKRNQVKVVDCATPLAWKGGTPFGIVAECTEENFVSLILAYMDGHLVLDDMLSLQQMMSVNVVGQAASLLQDSCDSPTTLLNVPSVTDQSTSPLNTPARTACRDTRSASPQVWSPIFSRLRSQTHAGSSYQGSNESLAVSLPDTHDFIGSEDEGELIKFDEDTASIDDLLQGEAGSGEALSGPVSELAPEALTPVHRRTMASAKPPNILVYCGKKDSARQFESVRETLSQCLNTDRYVIYHLKHEHVLTTPWKDNTLLLVISSDKVYDGVDQSFLDYFKKGGLIISFASAFDCMMVERVKRAETYGICKMNYKHWKDVTSISSPVHYASNTVSLLPDVTIRHLAEESNMQTPVMVEATHDVSQGVSILTQVNLDKDAVAMAVSPEIFAALKQANPVRCAILVDLLEHLGLDCYHREVAPSTPALLYCTKQEKHAQFLKSIQHRVNKNLLRSRHLTLQLVDSVSHLPSEVSGDAVPLFVGPQTHVAGKVLFDLDLYSCHLATSVLGQTVIYAESMPTTMTVIDSLMLGVPDDQGLVAIASRQTSGKGRGGNVWLNPVGCASFSTHLRLSLSSRLGELLGFVQHIAAVAAVHAIRSMAGYEELDIRLKWPNDIFFSDKMKLGGILVQSTIMQTTFYANIGIGLNVSNSVPTVCVNDIISQFNKSHGVDLPLLTVEEQIARTLTMLESLVEAFQRDGPDSLLPLYYKYWLHRGTLVKVESENDCEAVIVGLDVDGYLQVEKLDGTLLSLQPDGNSFDMMRNLICIRKT